MAEEKKSSTIETKTVCANKDSNMEKCCFDMHIMDRKLMTCCVLCALISVVTVFVIMKVGMNYHEEKIHSISEDYASLDNRVKSIAETITSVSTALDSLKTDLKLDKGNSSYVYTSLATMQRDIDIIKKELHIKPNIPEEAVKTLPAAKIDFIQTLENMINDGAPFESFIDSYEETIDMKKYASSESLMKFAKKHVKSVNTLEKEFISVSLNVFHTHPQESFWEKQKRVIKEKINKAITIKKQDETIDDANASDEELFNKATEKIADKKPAEALDLLSRIKMENEALGSLQADLNERVEVNKAFEVFKKEFVSMESQEPTPNVEEAAEAAPSIAAPSLEATSESNQSKSTTGENEKDSAIDGAEALSDAASDAANATESGDAQSVGDEGKQDGQDAASSSEAATEEAKTEPES
jgi:hypothetical protein